MDPLERLFTAPGNELDSAVGVVRSCLVYLASIALVRLGKKRFFAQATAFEVVLGVMLGSVMSRAINGGARLWPSLAAGAALVAIHWAFSIVAFRFPRFATLIKGHANVLVEDGQIDETMMARHHLTREDIESAMRRKGYLEEVTMLRKAVLEQNGEISVIV